MFSYRTASLFVFIVLMSLSTFYFIEDDDALGKLLVFAALYAAIAVFFVFKSLYYLRQKATFNEVFYVVGLPLLPPIFSVLGEVTGTNELYVSDFLAVSLNLPSISWEFSLSFASLLSLPYFFFSVYFLLRTFIRYEFIRLRPYSTNGPSATAVGLFLAIVIGSIYLLVSFFLSDVLIAIFGFMYALTGILGVLA